MQFDFYELQTCRRHEGDSVLHCLLMQCVKCYDRAVHHVCRSEEEGESLAKGIRGGSRHLRKQVDQEDKDWGRALQGDKPMNKNTEVGYACDQKKYNKT